ncbi:MAG: TrbC/VirB2 family protein [Sphingomonadaceae bacterium]
MSYSQSLLEPSRGSSLAASAQWIESVLLGEVAVLLAIIAVAVVGLMLLTGRLAARQAAKVAIGMAIVFGAPTIAGGLLDAAGEGTLPNSGNVKVETPESARGDLPPSDYNPYAGAALRDDR